MSRRLRESTPRKVLDAAREMRRNPTPAEEVLWDLLRGRRLANLKFRRQQPITKYIVDFCCAEHKLVVEVDGNIHEHEDIRYHDGARQMFLEQIGYRVLRFRNEEVLNDRLGVLRRIVVACGGDGDGVLSVPNAPSP